MRARVERALLINLISRDNGAGLSVDISLMSSLLQTLNHEPRFIDIDSKPLPADVNIFLEVFDPNCLGFAKHNIGVFNMEWFDPSWVNYLKRFSQIWAKTDDAYDELEKLVIQAERQLLDGYTTLIRTGFLCRDLYDEKLIGAQTNTFLHVRGKSDAKGTEAVIEAWRRNPFPRLTVIADRSYEIPFPMPPNVRFLPGPVSQQTLVREMHENAFHICPSVVEGFGHTIADGVSCGAIMLTTLADAMCSHLAPLEETSDLLITADRVENRQFHQRTYVTADAVAHAVRAALALDETTKCWISESNRLFGRLQDLQARLAIRRALADLVSKR